MSVVEITVLIPIHTQIAKEPSFPIDLIDVAQVFLVILSMRHRADYDPKSRFSIIETVNAIDLVKGAIPDVMKSEK